MHFPVAFSASLLVFTILSWYCGLLRLPVHLALLPFLALFCYHLWYHHYSLDELKTEWRWEMLFLICFFLMLDVRFVNPTISYAEKFMDHAFLASVMRNPVIPPLDPWFAGGSLNVYYYLGYWMFGCLGIVTGVPSNITFNLALPTVFGLAAINLYAVGTLVIPTIPLATPACSFYSEPFVFLPDYPGKTYEYRFMGQYTDYQQYHQRIPLFLIHMGRCPCPCCFNLQPGIFDLSASFCL